MKDDFHINFIKKKHVKVVFCKDDFCLKFLLKVVFFHINFFEKHVKVVFCKDDFHIKVVFCKKDFHIYIYFNFEKNMWKIINEKDNKNCLS